MKTTIWRAGAVLSAVTALVACGSDVGTEPRDEAYRVTAFLENSTCTASTCASDIRGTVRDENVDLVPGARVFTYYTTTQNATQQQGPTATTNASGAYVLRFNFPVVTKINYDIRVCAGTAIRQPDAQCEQIYTGFQ